MDKRPVLFLDSGLGCLPYGAFFHSRNRAESLICAADRENFPYGPRSKENVIHLVLSLAEKLLSAYKPKVLALACNTASVSALTPLREKFPGLPIVGTVPAVKPAVLASKKRVIGVLGTRRTVDDPYIASLAARYGPDCTILAEAAPSLVEFAEHRWFAADGAERLLAVKPWAEQFLARGADSLVLSCTHFLLLREEFSSAGGKNLAVFDSVEGVCRRVESILDGENGKLRGKPDGNAPPPLLAVTGKGPPEPHWERLASAFGFALETVKDKEP